MEVNTNVTPVEVEPTEDKVELLQRRIVDEMMSWNREQRRNFVRRTGGFRKRRGQQW